MSDAISLVADIGGTNARFALRRGGAVSVERMKTLSARDHAVAELALRPDATFPSTTDAWEQHINTWEKRLKNKELPLADVEASIRRRVAEWTPRKQRV